MNGPDDLTFASAYVGLNAVRMHYMRCEPCMFGSHQGGTHDWAGVEDVEHAKATGQPDPTGKPCACDCASGPVLEGPPDEPDFDAIDPTPCATCGELGACAYDSEGRALIHATEEDDQ